MKHRLGALFPMMLVCVVALGSGMAAAQSYPTKPVRLIIPFPPGGSNDIVGRFIATKLTERLGKQVVADNRGGAGGVIGTEAAAKSDPDGHTLLVISSAYATNCRTTRSKPSHRLPSSEPARTFLRSTPVFPPAR
jgi:tripartite-type tricarboxylate transporter receptor subunit TctC